MIIIGFRMPPKDGAKTEVWIGLVGVEPIQGTDVLDGCMGAYTNVVALACDLQDYLRQVGEMFAEAGLRVVEVEDVEPFSERIRKWEVSEELERIASEVKVTGSPGFDELYGFENED